jgi:alkanesulfonate monooxygenase SsuD/methylene tetrahydromethanopterin reductase-like flavin-dependent oxidoreductase (luciferase family)
MKISVVVASRPNVPPPEDLEVGVTADRLGFHELWVGEGWVWDAFVLATALASRTDHIPITVGPIPVAVRDPVMIASAAASTAAVAGRPVGVALGTSSVRYVEGAHGRSRRRPATALAESAQVVGALFAGDPVDFDGEVISAHGYRLRLDPPGGPITVAAFGTGPSRSRPRTPTGWWSTSSPPKGPPSSGPGWPPPRDAPAAPRPGWPPGSRRPSIPTRRRTSS